MGIIKTIWRWLVGTEYEDERGYIRDKDGRLVHRKVAEETLYNPRWHPLPFYCYDVHHKDFNKQNNNPKNLQLWTPLEHVYYHKKLSSNQVEEINKYINDMVDD